MAIWFSSGSFRSGEGVGPCARLSAFSVMLSEIIECLGRNSAGWFTCASANGCSELPDYENVRQRIALRWYGTGRHCLTSSISGSIADYRFSFFAVTGRSCRVRLVSVLLAAIAGFRHRFIRVPLRQHADAYHDGGGVASPAVRTGRRW